MNFDKCCRVVQTTFQIIKSEFIISTTAWKFKQEFFYSFTNVAKLQLFIMIIILPDRGRLSASSCHTSAWLQVVPAPGLNLHLDLSEF